MIVQDVLLSAPGAIRDVMLEAFKHKELQEGAAFRAKIRALEVSGQVARAAKPDGKPEFTNADQREAETRRRLEVDVPYNDAMRAADEEKAICAKVEAALTYQKNRFRAAIALSTSTGNLDLDFPDVS